MSCTKWQRLWHKLELFNLQSYDAKNPIALAPGGQAFQRTPLAFRLAVSRRDDFFSYLTTGHAQQHSQQDKVGAIIHIQHGWTVYNFAMLRNRSGCIIVKLMWVENFVYV